LVTLPSLKIDLTAIRAIFSAACDWFFTFGANPFFMSQLNHLEKSLEAAILVAPEDKYR